jgi:hydroxyacylglutathione hydrolase
MASWQDAGKLLRALPQWPVQRLHEELSRCTVLDVRSPEEWFKGHVPGAHHIFLPELPQRLGELPADKPLAVYCDSGYRASLGASLLQRHGFKQVASVPGSWQAWQAARLPAAVIQLRLHTALVMPPPTVPGPAVIQPPRPSRPAWARRRPCGP